MEHVRNKSMIKRCLDAFSSHAFPFRKTLSYRLFIGLVFLYIFSLQIVKEIYIKTPKQ